MWISPFAAGPEGSFSKLNTFQDGFRVLRVIVAVVKDFRPMLFFTSSRWRFSPPPILAGLFPVLDYLRYRYVYHVPLAILATGLDRHGSARAGLRVYPGHDRAVRPAAVPAADAGFSRRAALNEPGLYPLQDFLQQRGIPIRGFGGRLDAPRDLLVHLSAAGSEGKLDGARSRKERMAIQMARSSASACASERVSGEKAWPTLQWKSTMPAILLHEHRALAVRAGKGDLPSVQSLAFSMLRARRLSRAGFFKAWPLSGTCSAHQFGEERAHRRHGHAMVRVDVRKRVHRHRGHGGILRVLDDGEAAAVFNGEESGRAIIQRPAQDHADDPPPVNPGRAAEERIDGGPMAVFRRLAGEREVPPAHDHVAARRRDVNVTGPNGL